MNDFHRLMEDLGKLLDITLIPDKHHACVLNFEDEISVQLEADSSRHALTLATIIGEIPAGKFRELMLSMGLKYNALYPRAGTFAYRTNENQLVFFFQLPLENLQPETIEEALPPFIEKAKVWKESLSRGAIPPLEAPEAKKKPSLFDLKPGKKPEGL
ncbi:MAG TPA: hypothetical protein DCY54_02200 [Parachlamydiales bacterium]|nr:MAG: hypothetical protein A2098_04390 [Chlamydiae bacterium GWF2_49_8]HAZ15440.1 hypothetical protein [Parachlamydiales bacterium]HCJ83220.1 hypothetical protein [Parachlamydiales bacterium]